MPSVRSGRETIYEGISNIACNYSMYEGVDPVEPKLNINSNFHLGNFDGFED